MNKTKQIIAIAKTCGWTKCKRLVKWNSSIGTNPKTHERTELPDYLNDLNAMHEAEKFLKQDTADWLEYGIMLTKLLAPNVCYGEYSSNEISNIAHATAKQRAEAFLKTLNLWKQK